MYITKKYLLTWLSFALLFLSRCSSFVKRQSRVFPIPSTGKLPTAKLVLDKQKAIMERFFHSSSTSLFFTRFSKVRLFLFFHT